jgi:hypothetical protein
MPKRVWFPRGVKGWRKPPNVVMVTRATRWGNPFVVAPSLAPGSSMHRSRRIYTAVPTAEDAVRRFREYMAASPDRQAEARRDLRGIDLACNCQLDQPCHADVLLAIANGE